MPHPVPRSFMDLKFPAGVILWSFSVRADWPMFMCSMLTPAYRLITMHMVIAAVLSCLAQYSHGPFFVHFSDSTHIDGASVLLSRDYVYHLTIVPFRSSSSMHVISISSHDAKPNNSCHKLQPRSMPFKPITYSHPPSTLRICPVVYDEASLSKKTTV